MWFRKVLITACSDFSWKYWCEMWVCLCIPASSGLCVSSSQFYWVHCIWKRPLCLFWNQYFASFDFLSGTVLPIWARKVNSSGNPQMPLVSNAVLTALSALSFRSIPQWPSAQRISTATDRSFSCWTLSMIHIANYWPHFNAVCCTCPIAAFEILPEIDHGPPGGRFC